MDAERFVRQYYDALRAGDPLPPFFAERDDVVKFGISERLAGGDEVARGLRSQSETTTAWAVDSRDLRATTRDGHGWFSDDVFMGWTDTERSVRYEFDTRWSGTLARVGDGADGNEDGGGDAGDRFDGWRFVGMHVSTARSL